MVDAMDTQPLKLSDIRGALIRQEETIIFALIERSQFARNKACYKRGESEVLRQRLEKSSQVEDSMSFMEYFLLQTESLHSKLGRYNSPDENAFFESMLPRSVLRGELKESPLKPNRININKEVMAVYVERILDGLCGTEGDDREYGSTCACDIAVLQALSKRIHYGKFVAEAKFQAEREKFSKMILENDAEGIMEALTNIAVEDAVVERVRLKASRYGTDGTSAADSSDSAYKVQPDVIAQLYRDYLIPLNKDVQVAYLLQRLNRPSYAFVEDGLVRESAEKYFSGSGLACASVEDVFLSLARNQVAYGIVPIQDSSRGFFKTTQRALLSSGAKVCNMFTCQQQGVETDAAIGSAEEWTRYYIISNVSPSSIVGTGATHLVVFFGVLHEPGSLAQCLKVLGSVNMSCLESIPHKTTSKEGKTSDYAFFCEIEGQSMDKSSMEALLHDLRQVSNFVELAGTY